MMATDTRFDLTVRAGDDHDFNVTWRPDDALPNLTGASAEMVIEWLAGNGVTAGEVSFSTVGGDITLDVAGGIVKVGISNAESIDLPYGANAVYQLRVTLANGKKQTIAYGKVIIGRDLIDA